MVEGHTRRWLIGFGDVASITAVLLYGRVISHARPLLSIGTVETVLPFLVGWTLGAGLLGLYADRALGSRSESLRFVTAAWLIATAVGLIARTSPPISGDVTWPFGVVITVLVLGVLVLWRLAALLVLDGDPSVVGSGH